MQIKKHDRSHMVELRDGSAWRIWPGDIPKTLQWLPTTEIDVADIEDEICSHALIDRSSGSRGASDKCQRALARRRCAALPSPGLSRLCSVPPWRVSQPKVGGSAAPCVDRRRRAVARTALADMAGTGLRARRLRERGIAPRAHREDRAERGGPCGATSSSNRQQARRTRSLDSEDTWTTRTPLLRRGRRAGPQFSFAALHSRPPQGLRQASCRTTGVPRCIRRRRNQPRNSSAEAPRVPQASLTSSRR